MLVAIALAVLFMSGDCRLLTAQDVGRFPEHALLPLVIDERSPVEAPALPTNQLTHEEKLPPAAGPQIDGGFPAIAPPFGGANGLGLGLGLPHIHGFAHDDPDDPRRHIGLGQPLVGTSWLNRPYSTSLLFGGMIADDAISGHGELNNGFTVSLQQGYDFDHYYGGEVRIAAAQLDVANSPTDSSDDLLMVDVRLLHYPWGDSLWRPYYSIGIGFARHSLTDNLGIDHDATLANIPVGIGLKYQWKHHCAMRFDVTHNINFADGAFDTMDNVSITAGAEWRYGASGKSYYPWHTGVHLR